MRIQTSDLYFIRRDPNRLNYFLGRFLLMLESGERERLKRREKKIRDVNVGERDRDVE
jgi:hypothetical protein